MRSRFLAILVVLIALAVASPVFAGPISVSLVPSALNVAPGSNVIVSVNMEVASSFTMTAMNAVIFYDPMVFSYQDSPGVVQGAYLNDDWSPMGAAVNAGTLIVGAFDWIGELLPAGTGTLFTFTLQAKTTAPLGSSALSWGNGSFLGDGFGYGDENFEDVLVTSFGTSINVGTSSVPDPGSSLLLLGMGLVGLRAWKKRLG